MKKRFILYVLFLVTILSACTNNHKMGNDKVESNKQERNIKDMLERDINIVDEPEKIIAISPSNAEILYAIGAEDTLVARGSYVNYPEEVLALPEVESGSSLNVEQILSHKPDVVLLSEMAQTTEQVKALEEAGISVVMTDANNLEEVYESIELIGKVVHKEKEANKLIADMETTFSDISQNKEKNKGKTIYFEVSPLEVGLWTAGKGTFMQEIADIVGLENIFSDVSGWGEISQEQVIDRNPDYIVTITMYLGKGPKPDEEILTRNGWGKIKAIEDKRILNLANDELSRPGPRLAEGAKVLAEFVNK